MCVQDFLGVGVLLTTRIDILRVFSGVTWVLWVCSGLYGFGGVLKGSFQNRAARVCLPFDVRTYVATRVWDV